MKAQNMTEGRKLFFYHLAEAFFHEKASSLSVSCECDDLAAQVKINLDQKESSGRCPMEMGLHQDIRRAENAALGKAFFLAAKNFTSYVPPYGTLVGVKPVKVPLYYLEKGWEAEKVKNLLQTEYMVHPDKADLLTLLAKTEKDFASGLKKEDVMLYVSIPFCPSRCSYCSFISSSAPAHLALIPDYLKTLEWELSLTSKAMKRGGKRLCAIYIGGGTPGILSENQLESLLSCIHREFDLSSLREFCVEMGRPDTITPEKLLVLEKAGVNRISINPQTTCDETLNRIGRHHSARDFFRAMEMALPFSFSVNCDLISALPGETEEIFLRSVEDVLSFQPESVTIHALCQKKSATDQSHKAFSSGFSQAVAKAHKRCIKQDLVPYYLYRQKRSDGDLENLGFAKDGSLGIYNLAMMEDLCDIYACGAGGIGKVLPPEKGGKIQRFSTFKYPFEYLNCPEKIQERLSLMEHAGKGQE